MYVKVFSCIVTGRLLAVLFISHHVNDHMWMFVLLLDPLHDQIQID